MRRSLTLTKREQRQVERQLKKLDAAYSAGKVDPRIYTHKRAELLQNLSRPKAANTEIALNQKAFYQKRSKMEYGPAPVGYWERNISNSAPTLQANQSKIRASLLSIHNNEWWNDGFQEALRDSVNARQPQANQEVQNENELSYFQETVMQANKLAGAINRDTFNTNETWQAIENSEPVRKTLQRLANSVDYTVRRMTMVGVPENVARDTIRQAAISAGNVMTGQGYSKERAAEITAMVVRGELSFQGAVNQVTNDIQQTNEAIAAVNNNSANTPHAMWRNNFDIHATGPSSGGVSLQQLQQMRNELNEELNLENDPVARNEIVAALQNLENEMESRQSGMQAISNAMPGPPGMPSAAQGNRGSYNPLSNFRANQSTMQQTVNALRTGGPNFWNMVDDIVTIRGNMYFDYMAGEPIHISAEGQPTTFSANSPPAEEEIFPSGNFTVFASGKASIPQLKIMLNGIANALMSDLIPVNEKGYLLYLQTMTRFQISMLESQLDNVLAQNNLPNNTVNGHNHYFMANDYSPLNTMVSNGTPMPANFHNNLHAQGYLNQDPRNDAYWQRMAPEPQPLANNLHNHWMPNGTHLPIGEGYTQNIHNFMHQAGMRNQGPITLPNLLPVNNWSPKKIVNLPNNTGLNNQLIQQTPVNQGSNNPAAQHYVQQNNAVAQVIQNTVKPHRHYKVDQSLPATAYTQNNHQKVHQKGYSNNPVKSPPAPPQEVQTKQNPKNTAKRNESPIAIAPRSIWNRGRGGSSLLARGLKGSTSTTSSSRSHGGARFVNGMDPRQRNY